MSFWNRDKGEKRAFEYADEFTMGPNDRVRRACPDGLSEEARRVLAEALYATAEQLERDAGKLRSEGSRIVEAEAFGAIGSGR